MRRFDFDFVGRWRLWVTIAAAVVVVSVLSLALRGLALSIEFVGGSSFTVSGVQAEVTADQLEDVAEDAGAALAQGQVVRDGGVITGAIVRTEAIDPGSDTEQAVMEALAGASDAQNVEAAFVGPTWGEHISRKMLQALVVFLVLVVLYISVRLELKMAAVAIVALFHDMLLTAGIYSAFHFNVSPATVIALLTILGYSLYDTAIVFDRIKESTASMGGPGRRTYSQAANTAMNDVLWRSINTSITSLLPVGALIFIGAQALGATTLLDLAIALFVGMAAGVFSSLFIAGPALAVWKEREPKMADLARRAALRERRGDGEPEREEREPREEPQDRVSRRAGLEPRGHVRGPGRKPRSRR